MIHTIHTMTISRYGRMEKTGDASLMRRWYNPFPVKWYKGRVEKFMQEVQTLFGAENDNQLAKELDKAYTVNRMLQLSILYDALYSLLVMKASIDIALLLLDKDPKQSENLQYYKDQVKELTGIEINEVGDILKLKDEMNRLSDKFQERFKEDAPVEEDASFIRGAMAVFAVMEMAYNERMTLSEFAELRKLADDKRKQLEKQINKYGATG